MGFLKTTHRLGIPSSRHQVKFLQRRCRKHGPGVCWQPTLSAYRSRASKRSGVGARCGPAWRPWSIFNGDLNMKDGDATGKFLWRCEWWCPLVFNAVCNWKIPEGPSPSGFVSGGALWAGWCEVTGFAEASSGGPQPLGNRLREMSVTRAWPWGDENQFSRKKGTSKWIDSILKHGFWVAVHVINRNGLKT